MPLCTRLMAMFLVFVGILNAQVEINDPTRTPLPNDKALIDSVEHHLNEKERSGRFSGVVLIARDGRLLLHKAYGYARRENNQKNATGTRFNIGSITKSFTALAIHQLVEKGGLSVDDTLIKFFPDYPDKNAARKITIRHLLEMRSGVGDIFGEKFTKSPKESFRTLNDYLPLFIEKPLQFEPGTSQQYSNGGFILLGLIIEKVSGMDYYDYVNENIFRPAGMTASGWPLADDAGTDIAVGYTRPRGTDGPLRPNTEMMPARGSSAGGSYSTALDLLKYIQALQRSIICAPDYRHRHGMGIAGGAPGVNAGVEWSLETGYAVIVLANLDPPAAGDVAMQIVSWLPANPG